MKNIEQIINALKKEAEESKEAMRVKIYSLSDSASLSALQKYTDSVFRDRVRLIKQFKGGKCTESVNDCTFDVLRRRKQAIINIAAEADRALRLRYPFLSIPEEIVKLNAPNASMTFDEFNKTQYIDLAAAIWILDHLFNQNKLDDALEYLPTSRDELDSVNLPDISDSVHNDDIIKGMLYVIRNRNRGTEGFSADKTFIDDAAAHPKPNTGKPTRDRSNYEAIIHLIDTDALCEIRDMCISAVSKVTVSLLNVSAEYQSKINSITKEKLKDIDALTDKYNEVINQMAGESVKSGGEITVSASEPMLSDASKVQERVIEADAELNSLKFKAESFYLGYMLCALNHAEEPDDIIDASVREKLADIETVDPYAYCFGFLNLLDTDSDYAWIYNISLYTLASACRSLPWADSNIAYTENEGSEIDPEFLNAAVNNSGNYIVPPEKSILNRKIIDPPFIGADGKQISFSQLVFLVADIIPPRSFTGMSYMKALFKNSGLTENEIDILYEYLALAYSVSRRDINYVFIDENDTEETNPTPEIKREPIDNSEIKTLKKENKALKSLINRLEHKIKSYNEKLNNAEKDLEKVSAELAELRSMIRNVDTSDEDYSITVSFPYTSKKRTVIFGGHESWVKAIRPLLDNVRFIDASTTPNPALVMNAEAVWLQTNALSHSGFYKAIDIIRKHNIELHYFKYSSAEKCAEQFAMEDSEDENDMAAKTSAGSQDQ